MPLGSSLLTFINQSSIVVSESTDNPVNVFEQIDSLCRDFRRHLTQGERLSIEGCLESIDDAARETLFRNLLHLDIVYRRRARERFSSSDYIRRFPQYKKAVREAFFESTMMSLDWSTSDPNKDTAPQFEAPAAQRLGNYQLLEEIGRGGFGVVYRAKHMQREDFVALKTLPTTRDGRDSPTSDAERLHKFRREFRSLADISHPNLVGMQTLEVDGDQWFFTMDLIDGVDFLTYVRDHDQTDEHRLRQVLPQLASGIMALHGHQVSHRDLKPSNVMVSDDGRVTILDFGLVAELDQRSDELPSSKTQHFVGTPRYAAPEQVFGQRSTASDWYALGSMVYEALVGSPPFGGPSGELMVRKKSEDAPKLTGRPEVPQDLAELVDGLLSREASTRPDALDIAKALSIAVSPSLQESPEQPVAPLDGGSGPLLVGRNQQLADMNRYRANVLKTKSTEIVFVRGQSGEGKTSLAEAFLAPLRSSPQTVVLSGRCYDRESVPFKALDCVIDALCTELRERKFEDVLQLLPDDVTILAHLFPVMRRVKAIAEWPTMNVSLLESEQVRRRAFAALGELLKRLADHTPVVIFIDDLQWGDAESAEVLLDALLPPDSPQILFIGSYRTDERDESAFLQEWSRFDNASKHSLPEHRVSVGPLSLDQCTEMVMSRVGVDNESIRQRARELFDSTGGNPYFLDQLIDCLDPATGSFSSIPIHEVIDTKLRKLPEDATKLLDVIAVSGQAIPVSDVNQAAHPNSPAFSTLTHMRSERLVRLLGAGDNQLVDTYHDKIRETVIDKMPAAQRRGTHLSIAETIEIRESCTGEELLKSLDDSNKSSHQALSNRLYDLAYHFHQAGDSRGFAYQYLAGERALETYAVEDAFEHFSLTEESRPVNLSRAVQYRLNEQMGRACQRLRNTDKAISYFEKAFDFADSRLDRARAETGIGIVHEQEARMSDALTWMDRALREIGRPRPRTKIRCTARMTTATASVLLSRKKKQGFRREEQARLAAMEAEIYRHLSDFIHEFDILQMIHAQIAVGRYWIRTGKPEHRGKGYAELALALSCLSLFRAAKIFLKRAHDYVLQTDDPELKGFYLAREAYCYYVAGPLSLAEEKFQQSLEYLSHAKSHASFVLANQVNRHLLEMTSSTTEEFKAASRGLDESLSVGNIRGICWGNYGMANALARGGAIDMAACHMEEARDCLREEELNFASAICSLTDGFVWLQASDYDSARKALEESWATTKAHQLYMDFSLRALPLLIQSITGPDWVNSTSSPSDRKRLRQINRRCRWVRPFFPNLHSPIDRARGRALWQFGKKSKSIACFRSAIKRAREQETDYDLARALLDLASVDPAQRDEHRAEATRLLKKVESVIPYLERWQLGDSPDEACFAAPVGTPETGPACPPEPSPLPQS